MIETIYAVVWTKKSGVEGEFHYSSFGAADAIAKRLAQGWRTDAHVERRCG